MLRDLTQRLFLKFFMTNFYSLEPMELVERLSCIIFGQILTFYSQKIDLAVFVSLILNLFFYFLFKFKNPNVY